jgi:hypothetical protein
VGGEILNFEKKFLIKTFKFLDIVVKELARKLRLERTRDGCALELNLRIPHSAGPNISEVGVEKVNILNV